MEMEMPLSTVAKRVYHSYRRIRVPQRIWEMCVKVQSCLKKFEEFLRRGARTHSNARFSRRERKACDIVDFKQGKHIHFRRAR